MGFFKKATKSTTVNGEKRIQFNVFVKPGTKFIVRHLAAEYETPIHAVAEHSIDIGAFYMTLALKDREEKDRLCRHLLSAHMLGKPDVNEPDFLISSKPIFASILRQDIDKLYKEYKMLEYLAFKVDEHEMTENEWRMRISKTRLNLRCLFAKLIVKIDRLTVTDNQGQQTPSLTDENATFEEDFTSEPDGDLN